MGKGRGKCEYFYYIIEEWSFDYILIIFNARINYCHDYCKLSNKSTTTIPNLQNKIKKQLINYNHFKFSTKIKSHLM